MTAERDIEIPLDADGFMTQPEDWQRGTAEILAATDGLEALTDAHWTVLTYLRQYWLKHGTAPMIRQLCRETGFSLTQLYDLFPKGPARGACKYAGLPKPDGCV